MFPCCLIVLIGVLGDVGDPALSHDHLSLETRVSDD